ncbi:hypothetical protein QBC32DRAFT_225674 [Pseudoneurospora amorphoporcata]|uniref:Uncharacterized protein n=1 Tax=Pseudoneurospora amorphoporcata TaxID=241081 RepID=A0AAN6NIY4_9PEZI|nr:hypothetical protein QBC32DRAFT_225674 [Pseudoneurospora amorphoporcata]
MSFINSDSNSDYAIYSPASNSSVLPNAPNPNAALYEALDDIRNSIDDTNVARAALRELPQSTIVANLFKGLNEDDEPRLIPREQLTRASFIAGEPAFESIVLPFSHVYQDLLASFEDVSIDFDSAREIVDNAQNELDALYADHNTLKWYYAYSGDLLSAAWIDLSTL